VLVADDSLVIRAVVRGRLEDEGYDVIEAEDGVAAIEQCQRRPPDVILLDIEMPGLDGHQVLARLKADQHLTDIPVVFLTIRTGMDDVLSGLRGGAHDYLKKPFDSAELVARVAAAVHVKQLQDQLRERNGELERISRTDVLTGLYNRRHLEEQLDLHNATAIRHRQPLGVVLFDIDHFKQVNDSLGHHNGDLVLCEFARRLSDELRVGDIAGRWGGEEFLMILPHTDLGGTVQVADRIRAAFAASPVTVPGREIAVTVSGGCTAGPADSTGDLIRQADVRLYQAKNAGRNRVQGENPLFMRPLTARSA
jgi:diguanylate cyclase (GGDEF)-like protein